jgi:methionine salvage enolase-phosphatase E1
MKLLVSGSVSEKEAEILREEVKTEEKQVETKVPEKQPEQTTAPTAEALQAKCMELVRADRKNKQVIKDLLAGYSASLISDLDEAQRAELAVKLGEL